MAGRILQIFRQCRQHTKLTNCRPTTMFTENWSRNKISRPGVHKGHVRSLSSTLSSKRHENRLYHSDQSHQNTFLKGHISPVVACFKQKTTSAFKVIDGDVDTSSRTFQESQEHCKELEERVQQLTGFVNQGGGEKGMKTHVERNKKIFVRDRLRLLLDDYDNDFLEVGNLAGMAMDYGDVPSAGSVTDDYDNDFLEVGNLAGMAMDYGDYLQLAQLQVGNLAGMAMDYGDVPSAGSVTGVGRIEGVWCVINANDASVKGGTVYPIGVKKQLRGQEIGLLNRLPCMYLVDSGGAFLPLQAEIFPDKEQGGRSFYNEAVMSSMKIPQVAIVCGSCTAGGAYVPAMADECVIVHRIGTIFLGGPPLVYAATGEKITSEDLGGATLHSKVSGVTDHFAENEADAFETGRNIISSLNLSLAEDPVVYEEPLYPVEELTGLAPRPGVESECVRKILARLVDGSRFQEFKTMYGPTLVTGFAHIQGHIVGIVANNGSLTHDAALKGAHFVEICCQRDIPLIFLQNTTDDESLMETLTEQSGEEMGDILRARAKMMATIACASVPKLTIIIGGSYGANNFAMCGRSMDPKFLFTWPAAEIGILAPEVAVRQTVQAKFADSTQATAEEKAKYEAKVGDQIKMKASSFYASSRMWNDGIILPQETRKVLGQCLSIVSQHQVQKPTRYGVIRM